MPPPPEFQDLPEPKKPRKRIGPFGKLVGYLALFALAAGTVASINNAIAGSLNNNAVAPAVSPSASETPVTTPTPTPTPTPTKLAVDRGDYGVAAVQPVKHKKKKKKVAKPRPTPVSVPVSNSGYVRRTRG
jgi:hypothetical protein